MESSVSCQNPDLDSAMIGLCIRVLEKSYLRIGLIVSNQIAYSSKTNGYMWWRVLSLVRILIRTQNWWDSASKFWKSLIILEAAWSFWTKLHIQLKLMDISYGESCIISESWSGLGIDQTLHPFWKSWVFSESAWPFQTKLHIQVKWIFIPYLLCCAAGLCGGPILLY